MSKDNKKLTGDSVYRVKLYKDGKKWVAAGATTLALAAGLVFANVNANADTNAPAADATEQVDGTSSVSDTDTNTNTNDDNNGANVQDTTNDGNDGAKAATDDTATPVAASVTTKQEDPEVTAPASAAPSVTSDATIKTQPAESQSTSEAGSVVASGDGELQANKQVNVNNRNVQGSDFTAKKGATYTTTVTLNKDKNVNWDNAIGNMEIVPEGSDANGQWTAVSYSVDGQNMSYVGDTATLTADQVKNGSVFTINYKFVANDYDSTPATFQVPGLKVIGFTNASETDNSNTTLQTGWNYTTTVTEDGGTTTTPIVNPQATVTVSYVDMDGNVIKANAVSAKDDVNGLYNVTDVATIDGYTYKGAMNAEGLSPISGKISADGNNVVLVYAANPAKDTNIEVSYVDKNGDEIQAPATFDKGADGTATQVGGTYKISAPSIAGYEYAGYKLNGGELVNGTVAADDLKDANAVQFVYDKIVTVTVNYIDEATGEKIADSTSTDYKVGDEYTAEQKDIDGYTFVRTDTPLQGTTDANGATINVYYSKNETPVDPVKDATITVNYVDEDGNVIKDPTTQTGKVGDDYSVEKPDIDGYTFKEADAALNGTIAEDATVTLTYTKNETPVDPVKDATITVKYQDDKGNTIKADTTVSGKVGDDYSVEKPAIDGYTFVSADGDLEGTFAEDGTLVLTYTANKTTEEPGKGDNVDPKDPDTNKGTDTNDDNNEGTKDNGGDDTKTTEEDDDTTATPVVKDDNNNDGNGTAGVVASDNLKSVEAGKAAATTNATTLPQTDEANGTALAVLGLSTMLMGSALYFGTSRRKHEA